MDIIAAIVCVIFVGFSMLGIIYVIKISTPKKNEITDPWIFFRYMGPGHGVMFYPVERFVPEGKTDYGAMMDHINMNQGTLKVEDMKGNILWEKS